MYTNPKAIAFLLSLIFILSVRAGRSEEAKDKHFYFVQITDTHFGEGDHLQRAEKAVAAINKLPMKIACAVHTGDITMDRILDKKTMAKSEQVMGKLTVPLHYVAGNHDILRKNLKATSREYLEKHGGLISQNEYNGVVFIFIYTQPLKKSFTIEGYSPLVELEKMLKNTSGKPVIVFHHAPSVEDFYNNKMHPGWKNDVRTKWEILLNSYNVKGVITGHFHRDELHWLGNVPLYVCPPIAGYWGRQGTFRIYEYRNGKIGYRTQYIK